MDRLFSYQLEHQAVPGLHDLATLRMEYQDSVQAFTQGRRAASGAKCGTILKMPIDFENFGPDAGRHEMSIDDHVRTQMKTLGYQPEALKVRWASAGRLQEILSFGTDRDESSRVRHVDGIEESLMQAFGIYSRRDVTYVSDLKNWFAGNVVQDYHDAIIVYKKDHLFKVGKESNGFSAFLSAPYAAAIAVFFDPDRVSAQNQMSAGFAKAPVAPGV